MKKCVFFIILITAILLLNLNPVFANDSYIINDISHIYAEKNGKIIGSLEKGFILTDDNIIEEEENWWKITINQDKLCLESWLKIKNLQKIEDNNRPLSDDNKNISIEKFKISNLQFKNQPGVGLIAFIGDIENISNQKFKSVHFLFTIYDKDNNKIDSTVVEMNNINPHQNKYISGYLYTTLDKINHYKIKITDE